MAYDVSLVDAQNDYPEFTFVDRLTPSAHKAAFHVRNNRGEDLCLKLISPIFDVDRLQREILALQAVNHPNVARFIEYFRTTTPGHARHHILEEFVAGSDLSDKLQGGSRWPLKDAAQFFALLCEGLNALREKHLVHRDLKPSNIRVRGDGSPIIIDFGVARHLELPDLTSTPDGAQIGTSRYFAPEQWTGTKHDIDHRTDLFAVGILLYQALVGAHPFWQPGIALAQLKDLACNSVEYLNTPAFKELPQRWQLLVARLLEKQRAKRPADPGQVATILHRLGDE